MFQKMCLTSMLLMLFVIVKAQSIGINNDGSVPDPSAMLHIKSTDKGLLIPAMNTTQRDGISNPANGLIIFLTDGATGFYFNAGTTTVPIWRRLLTTVDSVWTRSGTHAYILDNIAIGSNGFLDPNHAIDGNFALEVTGSIAVAKDYRYATAKNIKYRVTPADMVSANPDTYSGRYDDGFSSGTINGLNSMWASGGTPGTVAYFIAPVHLPDSAVITALSAQLVKNGGSLQSIVELYRSDGTGYNSNTAQLIATCTTFSSGGIMWTVSAGSVNASFNVIDNATYNYFIRYSGEQNTQNVRFSSATITYQIYRLTH